MMLVYLPKLPNENAKYPSSEDICSTMALRTFLLMRMCGKQHLLTLIPIVILMDM